MSYPKIFMAAKSIAKKPKQCIQDVFVDIAEKNCENCVQ